MKNRVFQERERVFVPTPYTHGQTHVFDLSMNDVADGRTVYFALTGICWQSLCSISSENQPQEGKTVRTTDTSIIYAIVMFIFLASISS